MSKFKTKFILNFDEIFYSSINFYTFLDYMKLCHKNPKSNFIPFEFLKINDSVKEYSDNVCFGWFLHKMNFKVVSEVFLLFSTKITYFP
jgi:hypothetical protein